jgi:hypothetical protein
MTVREFEGLLASLGFPYSPVRQLTYLFEKVRYGGEKMNEIEEMDASQSLNQIIDYCRRQRA